MAAGAQGPDLGPTLPCKPDPSGGERPAQTCEEVGEARRGTRTLTGAQGALRGGLPEGEPCRGQERGQQSSLLAPAWRCELTRLEPSRFTALRPPLPDAGGGEEKGGGGPTNLLDVGDVHQLDDFVPLGRTGLGAFEAQVTTGGESNRGITQQLTGDAPSRPPPPRSPGGEGDAQRAPPTCRHAPAFYRRPHFERESFTVFTD